jgi:polyhydroxyalkanoate synthesis regulator phasin
MNLKQQLDIQRMYSNQASAGKNDIQKRDEEIENLQRKLKNVTKKDIIVKQ